MRPSSSVTVLPLSIRAASSPLIGRRRLSARPASARARVRQVSRMSCSRCPTVILPADAPTCPKQLTEEPVMHALTKLTIIEFKLFLRDPAAAFFTLAFPLLLLVLNGTGRDNKPIDDLGGHGVIDVIVPMLTVVVLAILAFTWLPAVLAVYRERRILRRLAATPLPASS